MHILEIVKKIMLNKTDKNEQKKRYTLKIKVKKIRINKTNVKAKI